MKTVISGDRIECINNTFGYNIWNLGSVIMIARSYASVFLLQADRSCCSNGRGAGGQADSMIDHPLSYLPATASPGGMGLR